MERAVAVWNEITTDFDPEEETANFGTRHALEADGNLYEVGAECRESCADTADMPVTTCPAGFKTLTRPVPQHNSSSSQKEASGYI